MELLEKNPLSTWKEDKDKRLGLRKKPEQSQRLEDDERYAVSPTEIRQIEENVGRNRVRDQLIIRLLWQTGMRRGEASRLTLYDLDRDS